MRGSKRRTVLQLGSPSKSSYLSRYGYGRNEEAGTAEENVQKEANQQQGLSLLGQYANSDSDEEEEGSEKEEVVADSLIDDTATEKTKTTEASSKNTELDTGQVDDETTETVDTNNSEKSKMDTEVASFLAKNNMIHLIPEIEAISADPNSQDGFPTEQIDRDSPELRPQLSADDKVEETQEKPSSTNYYKQFIKGESEFVRKPDLDNKKLENQLNEEIIIEEPVSLWERCLDENTKYHYFWNTISNEVTWEIPSEYSQYLLQKKEFEEKVEKFKKEGQKYRIKSNKDNDEKIVEESSNEVADKDSQESKEADKSDNENDNDKESVTSPHIPSAAADPVKTEIPAKEEVKKQETSDEKSNEKNKSDDNNTHHSEHSESRRDKHKKKKKKHKRDDREEDRKSRSSRHEKSSSRKSRKESKDSTEKESKEEIDIDIDIDDIDKALEMALETKTSKKSKKEESSTESSSKTSHKRSKHKHSRDASPDEPATKRTKLVDYSVDPEEDRSEGDITGRLERSEEKKIEKVNKSEEDSRSESKPKKSSHKKKNERLHVLDMAELCLSKLEFLEITKKGLSKLQILLIELETRYNDWQSGALETDYFLSKLKLANHQLELYEESAAPDGWTCNWDRPYRRYFYTNEATGESQWDYPEVADTDQKERSPSPMEEGEIPDGLSDAEENNAEEDLPTKDEASPSKEIVDSVNTDGESDKTSSQVVTEVVTSAESEKIDNPDAEEPSEREASDSKMVPSSTSDTDQPPEKEELEGPAEEQPNSSESAIDKDSVPTGDIMLEDESQTIANNQSDEKTTEDSTHSSSDESSEKTKAIQERSISSSDSATAPAPPLPPFIYPGQPPPPGTEFLSGLLAPPPPPPPPPDPEGPIFYGPLPQNVSEGQNVSSSYDVPPSEGNSDAYYQYGNESEMLGYSYNGDYSQQYPGEYYGDQQQENSEMSVKKEPGQEPGSYDYVHDITVKTEPGVHVKTESESHDYFPTDESTADSNYNYQHEIKNEPYFDECSESDIPLSKSPQIFSQGAGDSSSFDGPLPLKDAPDSPDPDRPPSPEGIIIGNPLPQGNQEQVSCFPSGHNSSHKEKKKKKDKLSTGLALKRKGVSSLVQKWQKVKKAVEKEEQDEERRQQEIRKKLDELSKDYL